MADVRDWSRMREMSKRLLEERTGKSLAAWKRRVKAEGLADETALRAWLEREGVTGYARDLLVWERFGYPDFMAASATDLIDGQYADAPGLRPIFDALVRAVSSWDGVAIQARKTYVSLVGPRRTFARVQAKKDHLAIALRLDLKPRGRLQPSRVHESMPVQVEIASKLDDEALRWVRRAYEESR